MWKYSNNMKLHLKNFIQINEQLKNDNMNKYFKTRFPCNNFSQKTRTETIENE